MGQYSFKKNEQGVQCRYRNGEYQDTAFNSEVQLLERIEELEAHMETFVARCEKGEVRSRKTYAAFKEALHGQDARRMKNG